MSKRKFPAAQFKAFYACEDPNFWPVGSYVEDTSYSVDGTPQEDEYIDPALFPDNAMITIEGYIVYEDGSTKDLQREFSRWLKLQSSQVLLVSIPKEAEAQLRAFVASVKGKVN